MDQHFVFTSQEEYLSAFSVRFTISIVHKSEPHYTYLDLGEWLVSLALELREQFKLKPVNSLNDLVNKLISRCVLTDVMLLVQTKLNRRNFKYCHYFK